MKSLGSGQPPCFSTATVKEEKQQFQKKKKKKKVMIDGIQLEDTLCTRNCRTRIMVINCECGLKTSIDNDFSARIKKIKKTVC